MLYELLCGEAPFASSTNKITYDFIAYSSKMPYFPAHVSHHARDLITRLLCRCERCCCCSPLARARHLGRCDAGRRDVNLRLGSGVEGAEAIKIHPCVHWHCSHPLPTRDCNYNN